MTIEATKLEHWRTWIGRAEVRREVLCPDALQRFAAAVQADLDVERSAPPLGHWAFFLPVSSTRELGADGHPSKGGFLPPVELPRRMFAAADITLNGPPKLGEEAELTSTVRDVSHRAARSGDLVFVEVERSLVQSGAELLVERQTLVYRGAGEPVPRPEPSTGAPPSGEAWTPEAVDLFRFSAATFNSHRIHYDHAYATSCEGYPGLVVHGPYTATRLASVAAAYLGRPLRRFSFRAVAPVFVSQPIHLAADEAPGGFRAVRCDGVTAMTATAE